MLYIVDNFLIDTIEVFIHVNVCVLKQFVSIFYLRLQVMTWFYSGTDARLV